MADRGGGGLERGGESAGRVGENKYLYNNRLLEERRRGWRREGGEHSLRHREREGNGGREKDEEEECRT